MSPQQLPPQALSPQKSSWWFVLGREPELSAAEIAAVLRFKESPGTRSGILEVEAVLDPSTLINQLGGTIKIAQKIDYGLDKKELIYKIRDELNKIEGKIHFGLSGYGQNLTAQFIETIGKHVKSDLKNAGRSVRYVPNVGVALSSATVDHNKLVGKGREFLIREEGVNKYSVAQTVALQPYEEFGTRDFGRPGRDDFSGMLPPKLAIMMINLSLPEPNSTIYDPFCGSGTIVTEAMLMGYKKIIGSDISEKAVRDTKTNIDWTKNRYNLTYTPDQIFVADATDLDNKINQNSIDRIVAESFLGKPLKGNERIDDLSFQADELKKLYLRTFESFAKIIKTGGIVVFIFPAFRTHTGWIRTECANAVKKLGFEILPFSDLDHLLYERPNQKLGREIWRFKKTS